ncbi:hypothetical protein [Kurthia massiliensis]|uniref:hypothetical protein n=1 Tax=Kurthia massiliensis TaxID=1033739 RepID=UPI0002F64AB3|nr:hypothetical protein [Kurthia massiliensis]
MDDFEKYLNEQLKNPEFAKLWYEDEISYTTTKDIKREKNESDQTHEELAERQKHKD